MRGLVCIRKGVGWGVAKGAGVGVGVEGGGRGVEELSKVLTQLPELEVLTMRVC